MRLSVRMALLLFTGFAWPLMGQPSAGESERRNDRSVRSVLPGDANQPIPGTQSADARLEELEEQAFKQAAALVGPSVVRIETVGGLDRVGRLLAGTGPTTGVVVSHDGYIISSAFNFASKPASILVTLPDGRRFPAETVANDRARMLTLLKINVKDLIRAVAARKQSFRVGQWSIAMGRTYGNAYPNVSVGIISALNRIWGKAIQTDAKVSPMNYGGPLVDIEGRVMGILVPLSPQRGATETAGVEWYDSGIGFAVPLQDIYASLDQLKSGEDLMPGLMGITLRGRDLFASEPVIDRVRYDSPAQKAGFQAGDVIVQIDGKQVQRQSHVLYALGNRLAGDAITVTVKRDEKRIDAELTLVAELQPYESAFLGILPTRVGIQESPPAGVGVRFVYPGSPAAKAGLQPRDRIIVIDATTITATEQLADLVSRIRPDDTVKVVFVRSAQQNSVEVKLSTVPSTVSATLHPAVIPGAKHTDTPREVGPKLGRFTDQLVEGEQSYWAYVPDDYNSDYQYGLMVWIHPRRDTMEAKLFKQWKSICDQRGLIILAPKAVDLQGWNLSEAESVKEIIEKFQEDYSIEASRIFLHSFSNGGRFATHLAFKYRASFRGIALASSPLLGRPPDTEPDFRLQMYFVCGDQDVASRAVQLTVVGLQRMKYSVSLRSIKGLTHKYPPVESILEIGRWADELDRI